MVAVVLCVLIGLIAAAAVLFYSLQKYIVATKDGISLDIPIFSAASPEVTPSEAETPRATAEIVIRSPDFHSMEAQAGQDLEPVRAVFVPARDLESGDLAPYSSKYESLNADAMILEMKPESGQLSYRSSLDEAASYGTNGSQNLNDIISQLKGEGVYLIAQISCFADQLMSTRNAPASLRDPSGKVFADSEERHWLDPYNKQAKDYINGLIHELSQMGFDEILLKNLAHPEVKAEDLLYSQDMSTALDVPSCISGFALQAFESDVREKTRISAVLESGALRNGANPLTGQDPEIFFKFFDRVYARSSGDTLDSDRDRASAAMETGTAAARFVPILTSPAGDGSWAVN